jgi:CheY-like chemotaxis protein/DNA-binding MarR family transcriptional regulator
VLDNLLFLRNYAFNKPRKISCLLANRDAMSERIYRLTKSGRDSWESQDAAVPADYRRLLWIMDFHGHAGLLQKLVGTYPGHILDEWLDELEQLGLIEQVPAGEELERDFAVETDATQRLDEKMLRDETEKAASALARTGAYLALDRLRMRQGAVKRPAETVVLIVEDDPDQLALADLRMTMAGYRVRVAQTANGFLQSMFDDGAPDLLLLDIELPDGDGFEILTRMRRHKVLSDLPIVLLTANNDPQAIGRGLALGADGYVTKPYTKNILADVVRRVLNQPTP